MHIFRNRSDAIRKHCGTRQKNGIYDEEAFSIYVNPSNFSITGVMHNERRVFYKFGNADDFSKLIGHINFREKEYSTFLQGIDELLAKNIDRTMELFDKLNEMEDEIGALKDENARLRHRLVVEGIKTDEV